MNALRALTTIANAHLEARAKRRTASIIANLPESVQKDIGWRWSSSKREGSTSPVLFDVI